MHVGPGQVKSKPFELNFKTLGLGNRKQVKLIQPEPSLIEKIFFQRFQSEVDNCAYSAYRMIREMSIPTRLT